MRRGLAGFPQSRAVPPHSLDARWRPRSQRPVAERGGVTAGRSAGLWPAAAQAALIDLPRLAGRKRVSGGGVGKRGAQVVRLRDYRSLPRP